MFNSFEIFLFWTNPASMTNCSLDGQQRLGSVALCISFPRVRFKIWSRQAASTGSDSRPWQAVAGGGNGGIDAECFQG